MAPLIRRWRFNTEVIQYPNATEQRWRKSAPLAEFDLAWASLRSADWSSIESWWESQKGELTQNISLIVKGVTYNNLAPVQDALTTTQRQPAQFDVALKLRQTQNRAAAVPVVSAVFPTFSAGVSFQRPLVRGRNFNTLTAENPNGPRYAWGWYGTGLTGFPTGSLPSWIVTASVLTDADLATFENFFLGMQGRFNTFSLTDPLDGVTYTSCRFDSDVLEIRMNQFNQSSISIPIRKTN